jgi:ketosteroid isomerase-like protein
VIHPLDRHALDGTERQSHSLRPFADEILSCEMSQENVELVKEFMDLFAAGSRDAWRDYFDPDVVWDTSASKMPFAGMYHGHEGVERFFREWLGAWRGYSIKIHEYIDADSSVMVVFNQSGIGRGSGVRADRDFFAVYDLKNSKVVRYRQYESRQEALEAAGLSPEPGADSEGPVSL